MSNSTESRPLPPAITEGAEYENVDVAVAMIRQGRRLLVRYSQAWGEYTFPMTKVGDGAVAGAEIFGEGKEEIYDAVCRAAIKATPWTLYGSKDFQPLGDFSMVQYSKRDKRPKQYTFHLYAYDVPARSQVAVEHAAEWLTVAELFEREPISETVRELANTAGCRARFGEPPAAGAARIPELDEFKVTPGEASGYCAVTAIVKGDRAFLAPAQVQNPADGKDFDPAFTFPMTHFKIWRDHVSRNWRLENGYTAAAHAAFQATPVMTLLSSTSRYLTTFQIGSAAYVCFRLDYEGPLPVTTRGVWCNIADLSNARPTTSIVRTFLEECPDLSARQRQ